MKIARLTSIPRLPVHYHAHSPAAAPKKLHTCLRDAQSWRPIGSESSLIPFIISVSRFDPCRCTREALREPKTRAGGPAEERNRTSVREAFQRISPAPWNDSEMAPAKSRTDNGQSSTCKEFASGEFAHENTPVSISFSARRRSSLEKKEFACNRKASGNNYLLSETILLFNIFYVGARFK